jgi:ADP-ribose pyrophosphatase
MTWKTLESEDVDQNEFLTYRKDRFRTKDGQEGHYHYIVNNHAVGVFARLSDGRFVMIREYRYTFDRISLSHVQGGIDEGETPEEAAGRELEEETGFKASSLTSLGWRATVPGFSAEKIHVFLAEDLCEGEKCLDGMEDIENVIMTADEIEAAIDAGEIWDSQVIVGWHLVRKHLG